MILIRLPMVPCLLMLLLILRLSSSISMVIFDIVVEKKSDSPDEDKCVHDSKLLIPTLKDFFFKHPLINPKTFLGDAAFDTASLYPLLLLVAGWYISIPKRISVHIPVSSAALRNGITPTKSGLLLKGTSIISKIISVWQVVGRRTKKLCMPI